MTSSNRSWADLPSEILELIGSHLETRIDVFLFRMICKSWRSVVPLSHRVSSTVYPSVTLPFSVSATAFLSPVTVCLLQNDSRTASCLIKVTESTSGKMKIRNPLSRHSRRRNMFLGPCRSVDVSSLRIVEISRGYRLKYQKMAPRRVFVKKVVLFGNECGILVLYDEGKLGYLGFKDSDWTNLGCGGVKYDDIVVYNGLHYVVDNMGTVYWVDGKSMSLVQFSPPLFGFGQAKNLVVSEGELYVVDSYCDDNQERGMLRPLDTFDKVDMKIYRLDEEWGTWVDVKSLGDRVFVLGKEVCFSVSTQGMPGCERNCIYFVDKKHEDRHTRVESRRSFARVFEIEDGRRIKTVDCFPSHQKLFSVLMNFPCSVTPVSSTE